MIEIRVASAQDAHLVTLTRREVWEETYRGIYPDEMIDQYDYENRLVTDIRLICSPQHRYFLFMDGAACAGYMSFGPYNYGTYKDYELCLNNLYFRKSYQGMGLGKQAFQILRDYAREHGFDKFFCGCNLHNLKAQGFYRHMGGIVGEISSGYQNKSDEIIFFEFYVGE